jgi:hypothetical protein
MPLTFEGIEVMTQRTGHSVRIGNWPVLPEKVLIWMEQAKQVAAEGYKQALEDGSATCNSESDSDHSDHGEDWLDGNMDTAEMLRRDCHHSMC